MSDRQPFVSSVFGDVFDVLTASDGEGSRAGSRVSVSPRPVLSAYRAVVVGGRIEWSAEWVQRLTEYVRNGGTVVVNAAQINGIPEALLGVHSTNENGEADNARCLIPGDESQDLSGQRFRYQKFELKGAQTLITTAEGTPLVTTNKIGKGSVIFCAVPDLLGEDERMVPLAAHLLAHVFVDATPVKVSGDVEYLINRNDSGWVVTLLNNNGVYKPQQGMPQVDRKAYVNVNISVRGQQIQSANEWTQNRALSVNGPDSLNVRIAPGGVAVVELRVK
jgi:hypothetical protein